jgi:hypothetical protein
LFIYELAWIQGILMKNFFQAKVSFFLQFKQAI